MRATTIEAIKRLSKGKSKLTPEEIIEVCADVRLATDAEVLAVLAPTPKKPNSTSTKPPWLAEMEFAKKRLKWSAREAVDKLVQVAIDEGLIASDPFVGLKNAPTFAPAAKKIAAKSSGDRLAATFVQEVARLEREYQLG